MEVEKSSELDLPLNLKKNGYVNIQDDDVRKTEEIMEYYRPTHCLPRYKSVFMVADPDEIDAAGGYDDYIYEVNPSGNVEKNDMAWYSEIATYWDWDDIDEAELRILAENYWNGVPFRNPANTLWEYRATSAEIINII